MKISEIYSCIQGEGKLMGKPSVLIRTIGCNLRCEYKNGSKITRCDTPYASWLPEKGQEKTPQDIVKEVKKHKLNYAIISGGEPFLQRDLPELSYLLLIAGLHLTIETNGTIFNEEVFCNLFSISPKLSNSIPAKTSTSALQHTTHSKNHYHPDIVAHLISHCNSINNRSIKSVYGKTSVKISSDYQLKFVVNNLKNEDEIRNYLRRVKEYLAGNHCPYDDECTYLMPEGISHRELNESAKICQEIAIRNRFCYSDRLHVRVYGHKRKV